MVRNILVSPEGHALSAVLYREVSAPIMEVLPAERKILYLHGFASSPGSRKARFLADRFEQLGIRLQIPDLAEDNFEKLTIQGQLEVIRRTAGGAPTVLIGSSLGGYLAALYAARFPAVERLVLLAPAFGFAEIWTAGLGPERMAEWKRTGFLPVFHYAELRSVGLGYQFIEDARGYEPFPEVARPALLFHGKRDTVVPLAQSERFIRANPQATLCTLSSDHELGDVLEVIWAEMSVFLQPGAGLQGKY